MNASLGSSFLPCSAKFDTNAEPKASNEELHPDRRLQQACTKLCEDFTKLFKPEFGCSHDFDVDVSFKSDAQLEFSLVSL